MGIGLLSSGKELDVHGAYDPRSVSHHLIELGDALQLRIYLFQAPSKPGDVAPTQQELLLLDFEEVLALVAADCHDRQVVLPGDGKHIFAIHHDVVCLLKVL